MSDGALELWGAAVCADIRGGRGARYARVVVWYRAGQVDGKCGVCESVHRTGQVDGKCGVCEGVHRAGQVDGKCAEYTDIIVFC